MTFSWSSLVTSVRHWTITVCHWTLILAPCAGALGTAFCAVGYYNFWGPWTLLLTLLWVYSGVIDLYLFDFVSVQFCYGPLDFYNGLLQFQCAMRSLVRVLVVLVLGVEEKHLEAEIHQAFAHCVFDPFNVNSTSDVVPRWHPQQPIFAI